MVKHLTLTLPNADDLSQMIADLMSSFRRLRQRKFWKTHVTGGVYVIEITNQGSGWHAHIHAIIQAHRLDWHRLHKEWIAASKGGIGVYIQNIPPKQALRYLTKYLAKPEVPEQQIDHAEEALKGRRLFHPFGSWHTINKEYKEQKSDCPKCKTAGAFMPYDIFYSKLIKDGINPSGFL